MTFPDIFTNPNFTYKEETNEDKKNLKAIACADGLCGWANCMSGSTPPEQFGQGMAKIGTILSKELGENGATPDALMSISSLFTKHSK